MPSDSAGGRLITTDVDRAAAVLCSGGLVAVPTETVYGLAADATNVEAVRRIFEVKQRPVGHPLIVHLAAASDLTRWTTPDQTDSAPSPAALLLASTAWPGPLTLILARPYGIPQEVAGGLSTIGFRVPAHALTSQLIDLAGVPIAAPSANRFGGVSPTTAQHVLDDLGEHLDPTRDVIFDGGPCPVGVESSIVDCTVDPPQLLRAGGISPEDLATLLTGVTELAPASGPARASGMLASHYAPQCAVRLVDSADDAAALAAGTPNSEILDLTADLAEYARRLYVELRAADQRGVGTVIAVLPEARGLGHAVRDRLTKASAPRPG